ncbi:MAG: adenine nucleotide alpha hydrolase [candidate division NC10 bacterium]|nr:adenine nucleotide alpha hydrolase [candidate division NC10 bacterium]
MPDRPRALVAWSSGKDSAWVLQVLRQEGEVEVVGLLTTFNEAFGRVAMHAVRRELVEAQARAAGLPLIDVPLPWPCSNAAYEEAMGRALAEARVQLKITHVAFGDLFLEDVRQYRESRMQGTGLTPLFPLWGQPTRALAHEMVSAGLRARITCIDPQRLSTSYAGRLFDSTLLDALPDEVDPCGERGEFHTFACAGSMFAHPIPVNIGEVVARDGFVFADLVPGTDGDGTNGL